MNPTKPVWHFTRRLRRDQRGAVALTFLTTSAIMIMGTLGAIDLARYNIAESRLQNAVDATSISAGQALSAWDPAVSSDKTAWTNYAGAFFAANMPDGYLDSDITAETIKQGIEYCTADPAGAITCPSQATAGTPVSAQYVKIDARGRLPLLSVGFLKVASLPLGANNQAIRRLKNNTEIVLALEDSQYTGSDNANIQDAARKLVAAALGAMNLDASAEAQGIRVGIVPFSAMVRMNPDGPQTPNAKNWVKTVAKDLGVNGYVQSGNWLGCVSEPYPPVPGYYWGNGGNPALPAAKRLPPDPANVVNVQVPIASYDINDPTNPSNGFQPVFMPIPATSKGTKNNLGTFVDSNKITITKLDSSGNRTTATFDVNNSNQANIFPRAPSAGMALPADTLNYRFIGMDASSNWGNVAPAVYSAFEPDSCAYVGRTQFLSQDAAILNTAIDTMQGNPKSESLIPGGLLWSWRMLAPEWSSDRVGSGRGWDDSQPDLPADPSNTDPEKAMVDGRAIVLVSTGLNSTAGDTGYRAPVMYNPSSPVQKSVFQMVVNYCNDGNTQPFNSAGVATGCPSGNLQTGVVTSPLSSTITGDNAIGNRGSANNPKDTIKEVSIWPATSLVNLDMRSPAAIVNAFAGYGSKLVGIHSLEGFVDGTATIGWPAGTTTGLTASNAKAYMLAVCDAIKSDNATHPIHLYTVFLKGSGGDQNAMGTCASGPAYAYTNEDTNTLSSTFAAILGSMTELRLTE